MSILATLVLAAAINPLPTCGQVLTTYEHKLQGWSVARRSIGETFEEHRYHRVSKDAVTHTVVLIATLPVKILPETYGYQKLDVCLIGGREATLYFREFQK